MRSLSRDVDASSRKRLAAKAWDADQSSKLAGRLGHYRGPVICPASDQGENPPKWGTLPASEINASGLLPAELFYSVRFTLIDRSAPLNRV